MKCRISFPVLYYRNDRQNYDDCVSYETMKSAAGIYLHVYIEEK